MKKINWPFVLTTAAICVVWIGVVLATSGCAKPDYAMIQQMHQSTMQSNERIAQALASMDTRQVEISFQEETLLPAGTKITTWYDISHAFRFAEGENPGVGLFKAEAERDSQVVRSVMGGLTTLGGLYFATDFGKTAIKRAGGFTLQNTGDGVQNFQGGIGDRFSGTGGLTESTPLDLSDATSDPTVVVVD